MLDRYTKGVLTVIAISLAVLAANSLSAPLPAARAQSTPAQRRCVWTQVVESGKPSLGENGEIRLGREWTAVSVGGWELKAAILAGPGVYVFERCEAR
jgi:hypothetical protein